MTRYATCCWTCLALIAGLLMLLPAEAYACTTCFGAAVDSPVTHGIGMAMLALVGTTGLVWSGIVLFFVQMRKRARMLEPGNYVVTEQGEIRLPAEAP